MKRFSFLPFLLYLGIVYLIVNDVQCKTWRENVQHPLWAHKKPMTWAMERKSKVAAVQCLLMDSPGNLVKKKNGSLSAQRFRLKKGLK